MNKLKLLSILILVLIVSSLMFDFAFAQIQPLVPCGIDKNNPCTACDLIVLSNRVIDFLFKMIILPLAALGILAAGLILLTAGGSQTQLEKGKSMLKAIIIGFFVAVSAWVIINTILGSIVVTEKFFNPLTEDFPACVSPDFFGEQGSYD